MPSQYSTLDENGAGRGKRIIRSASDDDDQDDVSRASSRVSLPSFARKKKQQLPTGMSEPLTASAAEEEGNGRAAFDPGDPFYVFREDLYRKLELVDEALAEFSRVVHQTVSCIGLLFF
jgi:hypothetical protein